MSGGAGSGRRLVLTGADGNRLSAFESRAESSDAPGIVVLPDVRGLHPFYEELAVRFAEVGTHAVAIDYFGRTAGTGSRGDDFDHEPHADQVTDENIALDVAAAVAHLRSAEPGVNGVFTVGFCLGGRLSFNQAAGDERLAGVIGFYGRVAEEEPGDPAAPIVQAARYASPVLGLFGGADPKITGGHLEAFRNALDAAKVPNEIVVYDGAPHSFFDRRSTEHRSACDDAWNRILTFIETTL